MGALTEFAISAMRDLSEIRVLIEHFVRDLNATEEKLAKRSALYPDETPRTNERYNAMASQHLGSFSLCRSVDVYNWYIRKVLRLVIHNKPQIAEGLDSELVPKLRKTLRKAREEGLDLADAALAFLGSRAALDSHVRSIVHRHLGIYEQPETRVICTCRNIAVHGKGEDASGELQRQLTELGDRRTEIHPVEYPPGFMPIKVENGFMVVNLQVGMWALRMIEHQIHLMDQHVAHKYKLPTQRRRPRPITFHC